MTGRRLTGLCVGVLVTIGLLLTGSRPAGADVTQYTVTGMVLEIDPSRRSFVVSHDAIPGVMAAMTMGFDVRNRQELDGVTPGTFVRFRLVLGSQSAHAEQVRIVPYQSVEQDPLTAKRLSLLRTVASAAAPVATGRVVPDFTLVDQTRRRVSLSQLRGKVVAVNFIYTSCALPQFCYRIANHFGAIRKRFQREAGVDLELLTITFDPARDTPEHLAEYAKQWNADPAVWHFLTGRAEDVRRVCELFGVDFFPDEGLMSHSIRTAVIDRDGRLVANIAGNRYTARQLGDLVNGVLGKR